MQTVTELFAAIGRERIRKEAGYGQQVLSRAVTDNLMPAHWYFDIRRMCEEDGIPCPEHLFRRRAKSTAA